MEYAWSDYRILIGGRFITGIREFKYKTGKKKEPIYAEGDEPVAMGRGNKEYSCEMKVLQSEAEAIVLSGGGNPVDIPPFTVVHQYQAKAGLPIVTDVVEEVEFVDFEKGMAQGAGHMEVTFPMVCLKIKYNVSAIPNQ